MRKRTYECTREIIKGIKLCVTVNITLKDYITIKEAEAELKEHFAEEWNCSLDEVKLKLLAKSGRKKTAAETIANWANENF